MNCLFLIIRLLHNHVRGTKNATDMAQTVISQYEIPTNNHSAGLPRVTGDFQPNKYSPPLPEALNLKHFQLTCMYYDLYVHNLYNL